MSRIVTIVTGPIVGLNSTEFLDKTIDFAQPLGIKIKAYNLFDEIIELAGINIEDDLQGAEYIGDLINGYEYQFKIQRDMAYFSIASKISRLPKDTHVIIRTPACIEWRGVSYVLKDHKIIAALINPDRIVTLIDAEWKIQKRLKSGFNSRKNSSVAWR
jgi:adenylate kinase